MSRWAKYDYSTPGVVDFSPEPYFVLFALLLLVYVFVCVTLALRVLYRDKNHCPRCGYPRPGVHGTVCPECGTGYTLAGKPAAPATGKGSNHSA
jgi:ribosomal protein S27AE